jgi:hypothetical protein
VAETTQIAEAAVNKTVTVAAKTTELGLALWLVTVVVTLVWDGGWDDDCRSSLCVTIDYQRLSHSRVVCSILDVDVDNGTAGTVGRV